LPVTQTFYNRWSNCWRIDNASMAIIVVADVGPRILHLSTTANPENQLYEVTEDAGLVGGSEFRMYGGHRLWAAPEIATTAYPDNDAAEVALIDDGAMFTSPVEVTGLQKQLEVQVNAEARVIVTHRITNRSNDSAILAPWALTVLRPGGIVILPLPLPAPHGPEHLLPASSLALWSYTDFSAPCWKLGPAYLQFDQRLAASSGFGMQKTGLRNPAAWGAYLRAGNLFIKAVRWREAVYPDLGSNFETFANRAFIELETLGPIGTLHPGETVQLIEYWAIFEGVSPSRSEGWLANDFIEAEIRPRAKSLLTSI
jgi:hypothetical protein